MGSRLGAPVMTSFVTVERSPLSKSNDFFAVGMGYLISEYVAIIIHFNDRKDDVMSDEKGVSIAGDTPHIERLEPNISDHETAVNYASRDLQAWKRIYELCIDLRNFEISQLVQRNNFFMIFQGVLLAGVCQSAAQIPVVSFMICLIGFVISLLQAGMAAGAKYWQSHWEINTQAAEKEMIGMLRIHGQIDGHLVDNKVEIDPSVRSRLHQRMILIHLFQEDYNEDAIKRSLKGGFFKRRFINKFIMWRCSASRIPIYAGLFLGFAWFVLLICTMRFEMFDFKVFDFIVGFQSRK